MRRMRSDSKPIMIGGLTDRRTIFKLGEGVDHVTRHAWTLSKIKR